MRSAEREGKSVVFDATNAVPGCHTLRGGVWHDFSLRSTTATFVYLPHFAVVIRFETALPLRTREKGGGRERPPQKQGGHAVPHRWHLWHASVRPPWGRSRPHLSLREGSETAPMSGAGTPGDGPMKWRELVPFPSRFIVPDRSSPSRVRFAASRPGLLRADPKEGCL